MKIKILFFSVLLIFLIGCEQSEIKKGIKVDNTLKVEKEKEDAWKIGIFTGSIAQNSEEYRAAQSVVKKYGTDHIINMTFPDSFINEVDTAVSSLMTLANEEDMKAIIICPAIAGISDAIKEIRKQNSELLIIIAIPSEAPENFADVADIILDLDMEKMGEKMVEQVKKQGAKTFVHYSFSRHLSYPFISNRRDIIKRECEENGIEFVDSISLDPTARTGITAAKHFITEDVPRKILKYGKDTAFFSTNCAVQTDLIKSVFEGGGIYPQPCCPSPYHGFPGALDINVPYEKACNSSYLMEEITNKIKDKNMEGRLSTWPVPCAMMFIEAGSDYAYKWIQGDINNRVDKNALTELFKEYVIDCCAEDIDIYLSTLKKGNQEYNNYFLILQDYINF